MRPTFKSRNAEDIRILVIEDDPNDRELLFHRLHECQMDQHIRFIASGKEALNFLTGPQGKSVAKKLVAIFLDLDLPGLGGIELLRRLRQYEEYEHIPVIVITGSSDPKDFEECRRLEVTHYIAKPITFAAFAKAVADTFHPSPSELLPAMTLLRE